MNVHCHIPGSFQNFKSRTLEDSLRQNINIHALVPKYIFKEKELMPDTLVRAEGLILINKILYHP